MAESKLIDVANDFYQEKYDNLKKELESGTKVEIYVDCIGHTRARMVEQDYASRLKDEYGDRLIITGIPGAWGYYLCT